MGYEIKTDEACRVVGFNRALFYNHVAAGNLTCVPAGGRGKVRLFEMRHLLALSIFQDEIARGLAPKRAGEIACEVSAAAQANIDEKMIVYVYASIGSPLAVPASEFHVEAGRLDDDRKVVDFMYYEIEGRRAAISRNVEFEEEKRQSIAAAVDEIVGDATADFEKRRAEIYQRKLNVKPNAGRVEE